MSDNSGAATFIGVFFGLFVLVLLILIAIAFFLLYRVIIMFYDFNKYKYNLLIVLLTTVTLIVLDNFTQINDFTIRLTNFITTIFLIILSYYPLSNSAKNSSAKLSSESKPNNANKK